MAATSRLNNRIQLLMRDRDPNVNLARWRTTTKLHHAAVPQVRGD
jgi:hypothetical protein